MAGARSEDTSMKAEVALKFWKFLDKLHDEKPEVYDQFITETIEEGREMMAPPEPCYCLKLSIAPKYNCSRLFLNVCQWKKVPQPKTPDAAVPFKGGVLRHRMDKVSNKKTDELIYDIGIHPDVIAEAKSSKDQENSLNQLCFSFLEEVVKITVSDKQSYSKAKKKFAGRKEDIQYSLDNNWRQHLPKDSRADFGESILKEIGKLKLGEKEQESSDSTSLPSLKVRLDPLPTNTPKPKLIEEISSFPVTQPSQCRPEYTMTVRDCEGGLGRAVCIVVSLPGVRSAKEITLDVAKDSLSLSVDGCYELSVELPAHVNEDTTKASFKTKTATLSVTMPCA